MRLMDLMAFHEIGIGWNWGIWEILNMDVPNVSPWEFRTSHLLRDEESIRKPWDWLCRRSVQQAVTVGHIGAPNIYVGGGVGTTLLNYFWEANLGNPWKSMECAKSSNV
jgi:hypothetical protein